MVRAEHRGNVPGIVHGSSTTGADAVPRAGQPPSRSTTTSSQLEDREREEIFRVLLELTDRFRARAGGHGVSVEAARELDVLQAKARYSSKVNGIEPEFTDRHQLALEGGAASDARPRGAGGRAAGSAATASC